MGSYITSTGKKLVENEENIKDPNKFTTNLLLFMHKLDNIIVHLFDNNILFIKQKDTDFQEFFN